MKTLGYIKDKRDRRDLLYSIIPSSGITLPESVDLRSQQSQVKNQGGVPACVGFSAASMKDWQEQKQYKKGFNFDGDWLYNRCKDIDGYPFEAGTEIRYVMKVLAEEGAIQVGDDVIGSREYCIKHYARVRGIDDVRRALVESGPVIIGIDAYQDLMDGGNNGFITLDKTETYYGGHAVIVVGYNDKTRMLAIKNSWGEEWGDKGYGYISYDYLLDGGDMWVAVDQVDQTIINKIKNKPMSIIDRFLNWLRFVIYGR